MGLTRTYEIQPTTHNVRAYIAGFMDADGSVGLYGKYCHMNVSLSQSKDGAVPEVFTYIAKYFPTGDINPRALRRGHKQEWLMVWNGRNAQHVLQAVEDRIIVKQAQVQMLLHVEQQRVSNQDAPACYNDWKQQLKAMKTRDAYNQTSIDRTRLNDPYLAGFFDGDGTCCVSKGVACLGFAQANSRALLEAIKDYFGGLGCIPAKGITLTFWGRHAFMVASRLVLHTVYKTPQLRLLLSLERTPQEHGKPRSPAQLQLIANVSCELQRLKLL
jgi:hypothetical protein